MAGLDELFNDELDAKTRDFLNDEKSKKNDGLYKVDFDKVKDKRKGWRSVIRFLPNLRRDGTLGPSAIKRIYHYVDIPELPELKGIYDSPSNFGEPCKLSNLYFKLKESKNAILAEKAKLLKFYKKYYSYILVLEDEQQPELVGKIMIFQYGEKIKDKILAENNGEITGEPCNVFRLDSGKDFILIAKKQNEKDYQMDYSTSSFKPEKTSLPIYNKETKTFRNIPLENGKIPEKYREKIKEFLLDREHDLEEFEPKRLTEEQLNKIEIITNYLLNNQVPSSLKNDDLTEDDFLVDEVSKKTNTISSRTIEDDDDDDFLKE